MTSYTSINIVSYTGTITHKQAEAHTPVTVSFCIETTVKLKHVIPDVERHNAYIL